MKWTSAEAHVYMRHHQGAEVEHFEVSKVIYHKFSQGAVSYTLDGKNVYVMLEYSLNLDLSYKNDLDYWACFGRENPPFYNRIIML